MLTLLVALWLVGLVVVLALCAAAAAGERIVVVDPDDDVRFFTAPTQTR